MGGLLRLVPARVKLWLYMLLCREAPAEDGGTGNVWFMRFGIPLVLKRSDRIVSTEADALRFLNKTVPYLPIPTLVDSFHLEGVTYTLMSRLSGRNLLRLNEAKEPTVEEIRIIAEDILAIIEELWRIPQPPELAGQVMISASGHGLPHPVSMHETLGGPYSSTIDCYKTMVMDMSALPPGHFRPIVADAVAWVHWDLTMRNILIHNGRVSGIVDWEDAGWLPRHWLIHSLRSPRPGCQGVWARHWYFHHRFEAEIEEAYAASCAKGVLTYPLC
ncbi:hypothetical protein BDW22DRAFT_1487687 [Trametopsis cervina]|nr:hypothetical protein BDW22DRAFT_1487687 [Trametopsis cervina]